jgi:hypothetical protein
MSGKKLAARGGDFDPDPIVRLDQRSPGARDVGLMSDGQDKGVGHAPNEFRIGLVIPDRVVVMRPVNDRGSRSRWRSLSGRTHHAGEQKSD